MSRMNFTSLNNLVFIYTSLCFFTAGVEELLIQPTVWYYMKYLGKSNFFLGLTVASFSVGMLLFAPVFGVLDVKLQSASKAIVIVGSIIKTVGSVLYLIPVNGYFPLSGRFISGVGESTAGVLYGVIAKGTTTENRVKAFLYFEGLFIVGKAFGPSIGSVLIFNLNIFGWQINPGNSPALFLAITWCFLLILSIFLPHDLAGNPAELELDSDTCSEDNMDKLDTSRSVANSNTLSCPHPIVFSLYFYVFLFVFVSQTVFFYAPLLAVHQFGLRLFHVKLLYINCTLFVLAFFMSTYLFLERITHKNFLGCGIISLGVPISIIFLFAHLWNKMSVNFSYLLLFTMLIVNANAVNLSLIGSLLSKLTPLDHVSFYQSLTFTILHIAEIISRVAAGATFSKTTMMYTCLGITIGWLIAIIWFGIEYKNFTRVSEKMKNKS